MRGERDKMRKRGGEGRGEERGSERKWGKVCHWSTQQNEIFFSLTSFID